MSAAISAAVVQNEREIQPMQLSLEQLNALKTQHENELQELQKQLETLHGVKSRLINARVTLDDIATSPEGAPLLVPLNGSLYAPGSLATPEKVIVELGTGYFCEKTIPDAKGLIDRKVQLVTNSMESIEGIGSKKRRNLEQIVQIMQYKIALAQEQRETARK